MASILLKLYKLFGVFCICVLLCCCGSKKLDEKIRAYVKDEQVTSEEWADLCSIAKSEGMFCKDNTLDYEGLKGYIEEIVNGMRGVDHVEFPDNLEVAIAGGDEVKDLKFKFFLERSGSMTPFDAASTNGEFKKAISQLLGNIPSETSDKHSLYIVNDSVYPYSGSYQDFLKSFNIFDDTKGVGNPSFTDFSLILSSIAKETKGDEVSVLASDLLYSTPNMAVFNREKILNEAEILTHDAFKDISAQKNVLIVKLISSYDGPYYPYNSPSKGIAYKGKRPYYLLLVASPVAMKALLTSEVYNNFSNFKGLEGFENYYCFSSYENQPAPYHSVLLSGTYNLGRISAAKGQGHEIHEIVDAESDRDGFLSLPIAIDMKGILTPEEYKLNKENYTVDSKSGFKIDKIIKIEDADISQNARSYVGSATHILVVKTSDPVKYDEVKISLNNSMPQWIADSSSDDDTDVNALGFDRTTFAFKNFMDGIYHAYNSTSTSPKMFNLVISIK